MYLNVACKHLWRGLGLVHGRQSACRSPVRVAARRALHLAQGQLIGNIGNTSGGGSAYGVPGCTGGRYCTLHGHVHGFHRSIGTPYLPPYDVGTRRRAHLTILPVVGDGQAGVDRVRWPTLKGGR